MKSPLHFRLRIADCSKAAFTLALFLCARVSWGQSTSANAVFGASLLNNGVSARALGLGQAFVGVADDISTILWNPAGLASLPANQISVSHQSWIADSFQESILGSFSNPSLGGMGLSANYTSYGVFSGRDDQGSLTRPFGANELSLGLSWSRRWFKNFYAGAGLRLLHQSLDDAITRSAAFDFGLLWVPNQHWRVGAAYNNLGAQEGNSPQFAQPRLGASYTFLQLGEKQALLALATALQANGNIELDSGLELEMGKLASLRVGYRYQPQPSDLAGVQNVSLGLGFVVQDIGLDYTYLPLGALGNSHNLTLSYFFPELPAAARPLKELWPIPPALPTPSPSPVLPSSTPTPAGSPSPLPTANASPQPSPSPLPDAEGLNDKLQIYFKVSGGPEAQAEQLEEQGRTQEALQLYSQAAAEKPDNAQIWAALGKIYYSLGKRDLAIACFDEVLRLDQGNDSLRLWLEKYRKEKK